MPNDPELWNFLIVDDTRNNLYVLGSVLRAEGYRIAAALSGREALDLLSSNRFDLILLDIRMPGMDGIETCKRIKADPRSADIPVLFISAVDDKELIAEAFAAGGRDYILKPFDPVELLARVESQIDIQRGRRLLQKANEGLEELVAEKTKELVEKNASLERALAERSLLLQEVYHRVNNNLQFVTSLLSVDAPDEGDGCSDRFLSRFESRILSLAEVNGFAYRSSDLSGIDMVAYTRWLFVAATDRTGRPPGFCVLNTANESFRLGINYAIPCGLALNEIIRIAVEKSAEGKGEDSAEADRLDVAFAQNGQEIRVDIRLDGELARWGDAVPSGSVAALVEGLVEDQLHGTFTIGSAGVSLFFSENHHLETFHDLPVEPY